MPQHRALGPPGGAAGILQQGEIDMRVDGNGSKGLVQRHRGPAFHPRAVGHISDLAALQQLERQPLVPRQHLGKAADHQRFEVGSGQHLAGGGVEFRHVERHQHPRAGIADLPCQLLDRVEWREIDHDRARHHRPVIGGGVDRHIGQEQADTVSLGDAHRLQSSGKALRIAADLAVGIGPPEEIQERCRRIGAHGAFENRGEAHRRKPGIERNGMVIGGPTDSHVNRFGRHSRR